MSFNKHLGSIIFGIFILASTIGAGFIIKALFDSKSEGGNQVITLTDIQSTMSKISIILYMIITLPVLFYYLKMVSKSS